MSTNRISKIVVVLLVIAVALVNASFATRSAILAADRSYNAIEAIRLER